MGQDATGCTGTLVHYAHSVWLSRKNNVTRDPEPRRRGRHLRVRVWGMHRMPVRLAGPTKSIQREFVTSNRHTMGAVLRVNGQILPYVLS